MLYHSNSIRDENVTSSSFNRVLLGGLYEREIKMKFVEFQALDSHSIYIKVIIMLLLACVAIEAE